MINKDFLDEKDIEIFNLKRAISEFKKYDEERKKFINSLQDDLEDISFKYTELRKNYPNTEKVIEKNKSLQNTISKLNNKNKEYEKILSLIDEKDRFDLASLDTLTQQVQQLEHEVEQLRNANSQLIYKLYHPTSVG